MANDLQTLVGERLASLGSPGRPLSYRAAAARSNGLLSHTTIGNIARGTHRGAITEETVAGLALGLDVSRTRIEKAAGIYRERPAEPFTLPPRASRLNRREREIVLGVVDGLLAAADRAARETASQQLAHTLRDRRLEVEQLLATLTDRGWIDTALAQEILADAGDREQEALASASGSEVDPVAVRPLGIRARSTAERPSGREGYTMAAFRPHAGGVPYGPDVELVQRLLEEEEPDDGPDR